MSLRGAPRRGHLNRERREPPNAASGRNQNLFSRQDAKSAKRTSPECPYPWRSWRLGARHNSFGLLGLPYGLEKSAQENKILTSRRANNDGGWQGGNCPLTTVNCLQTDYRLPITWFLSPASETLPVGCLATRRRDLGMERRPRRYRSPSVPLDPRDPPRSRQLCSENVLDTSSSPQQNQEKRRFSG